MNCKVVWFVAIVGLSAPFAYGDNNWVDWSTGAIQPFQNSTGGIGTVSYTHTFSFVGSGSVNSPDTGFPFTNPIEYLSMVQVDDASIEFTFTGVSPDSRSIFTLGNLRPTNRFVISAFDLTGGAVALSAWTNHGEYRLFSGDNEPNLWIPATGELIGNGQINQNSRNIFLGLTSNTHRIRVDYDGVDGDAEFLDIGIAGGGIPEPSSAVLLMLGGMAANYRRRRSSVTPPMSGNHNCVEPGTSIPFFVR
jgi:hypothetical protein